MSLNGWGRGVSKLGDPIAAAAARHAVRRRCYRPPPVNMGDRYDIAFTFRRSVGRNWRNGVGAVARARPGRVSLVRDHQLGRRLFLLQLHDPRAVSGGAVRYGRLLPTKRARERTDIDASPQAGRAVETFQHGASIMKPFLLSLSVAASMAMVATALATSPARAQEYQWCANASQFGGAPLCSFATLEQCQAFLSGQAGFCQQNARAASPAPAGRRGAR